MHPAKSVIFFTTASGAGYGLIALASLLYALGFLPSDPVTGVLIFGIGLLLIVGGLLSSTLHLGHPERAWRALSQWRSSWLSREGLSALLTFVPIAVLVLDWLFIQSSGGVRGTFFTVVALLTTSACLLTVFTTAMIYASLKTIAAWHNRWTIAGYLVFGLMCGAIILDGIVLITRVESDAIVGLLALILLTVGFGIKLAYWHHIDTTVSESTPETATGLGAFGKVSLLDPPHDGSNFLLSEMGFEIARKHATKLRRLTLIFAFIAPGLLIAVGLISSGPIAIILALAAIGSMAVGIVFERWLFFAEAKHTVLLYYGAKAA